MVRAPPDVAGSGPRGSSSSGPASGHVRWHRSSVPTALDSTGTGFQYHGVDTASQPRLDCRLGRLVPHHTSCWHPFFRPTPHPSCPSSIMVGNGSCLPVTSVGTASGPFRLPNVLVAPNIVHNLLSIRQFTTDNSCSVDFDPSGLTVKDLASRRPLLRCDSTGPFYTLRFPTSAAPPPAPSSSHLSAAFATTPSFTTCTPAWSPRTRRFGSA